MCPSPIVDREQNGQWRKRRYVEDSTREVAGANPVVAESGPTRTIQEAVVTNTGRSTEPNEHRIYDTEATADTNRPVNEKLVKAGLLRGGIPLVVMLVMALLIFLGGMPSDARSMALAAVLVASVGGFTVLYEIESWSLLKQSVVHLFAMAVTQLPVLFFAGWFPIEGPRDVLVILGVFLAIGVVLWSVGYLISKKRADRLGKKHVRDVP